MGNPPEVNFKEICREKQLAVTHQRLVVHRALMQMTDHPSPEQVFERVRTELPSISLATVYKTLHTFLEAGIISQVSPHHGSLRVEPNIERHHHFICLRCHTITDLAHTNFDEAPLVTSVPSDFQVEQVSMEIRGLCGHCVENIPPAAQT